MLKFVCMCVCGGGGGGGGGHRSVLKCVVKHFQLIDGLLPRTKFQVLMA